MITPEKALEDARAFYAEHDPDIVVDRLVEDDTHYGVCTLMLPGAEVPIGMPLVFVNKETGEIEVEGSDAGLRMAMMDELAL